MLTKRRIAWMLAVVFVVLAGGLFIAAYKAERKRNAEYRAMCNGPMNWGTDVEGCIRHLNRLHTFGFDK
jgi:hypothetical protein